jgi:hypothetical protein
MVRPRETSWSIRRKDEDHDAHGIRKQRRERFAALAAVPMRYRIPIENQARRKTGRHSTIGMAPDALLVYSSFPEKRLHQGKPDGLMVREARNVVVVLWARDRSDKVWVWQGLAGLDTWDTLDKRGVRAAAVC